MHNGSYNLLLLPVTDPGCSDSEFTCCENSPTRRRCIPDTWVCNGVVDCYNCEGRMDEDPTLCGYPEGRYVFLTVRNVNIKVRA